LILIRIFGGNDLKMPEETMNVTERNMENIVAIYLGTS